MIIIIDGNTSSVIKASLNFNCMDLTLSEKGIVSNSNNIYYNNK